MFHFGGMFIERSGEVNRTEIKERGEPKMQRRSVLSDVLTKLAPLTVTHLRVYISLHSPAPELIAD